MATTLAEFNAIIQAAGLPCELVKGKGYHYFITTPDQPYRSKSHSVFAFTHVSVRDWAYLARDFINEGREPGEPA
jgi:hypothetical protein